MNQNEDVEVMLANAIALAKAGERSEAVVILRQILDEAPDNVLALLWLAFTSDSILEIEAALDKVLKLDPGNKKALEWQELTRQRKATKKQPPSTTNNLATYNPNGLKQRPVTDVEEMPPINNSEPTLSFNDWQNNLTFPKQPASSSLAEPVATPPMMPNYQIREISQPQPSNPVQIVIQMPDTTAKAKSEQNLPNWFIGLMVGLVILLVAGIGYVLVNQTPATANFDRAVYQSFNSPTDLANSNPYVNQKVNFVFHFAGGYPTDPQGNTIIKLDALPNSASSVTLIWNPKQVPMNFGGNQIVRVYGSVQGNGSNITINVEQAERG